MVEGARRLDLTLAADRAARTPADAAALRAEGGIGGGRQATERRARRAAREAGCAKGWRRIAAHLACRTNNSPARRSPPRRNQAPRIAMERLAGLARLDHGAARHRARKWVSPPIAGLDAGAARHHADYRGPCGQAPPLRGRGNPGSQKFSLTYGDNFSRIG
jgi:hypothetical protein